MDFSVRRLARRVAFVVSVFAACLSVAGPAEAATEVSVTTYHNDSLRTGWNPGETTLSPKTVTGGNFGLIASVQLDDEVDAQPLVVPNQAISGQGTHDVVYVATESNSVYAIDADSGQVLLDVNLGAAVPYYDLPGGCNNNGPNVGINSTPVIDSSAGLMYVIAYTLENGAQTFRIHALNLTTLADAVPSVVITASGKLSNGQTYQFQAASSRQRPGLLLANGNVYAGFGSFCDINANVSRGWVLGWQAGTLTPLPANHLNNLLGGDQDDFFLTSVWMSGYGLAADTGGDIYFVTGNSDYSGDAYNTKTNLSESVLELSTDLTKVENFFTPGNVTQLEKEDGDFGSGGLMLLPPQKGAVSDLAVAAGKDGTLYLLNADKLGKRNPPLGSYNIGGCWCGQSYFQDGKTGEVVTSGGNNVNVYSVQTGKRNGPSLLHQATSSTVPGSQDPGFLTSVSSNGTKKASAIIWAVSRPTNTDPADIYLIGFDDGGQQLVEQLAGTWPDSNANSDTVPTVANGKVYVASYQSLAIFGLNGGKNVKLPATRPISMVTPLPEGVHEIRGIVKSMNGNLLRVAKRDGSVLTVDTTQAERESRMAEPSVGHGVLARGTIDATGILRALVILHAKNNAAMWPADR